MFRNNEKNNCKVWCFVSNAHTCNFSTNQNSLLYLLNDERKCYQTKLGIPSEYNRHKYFYTFRTIIYSTLFRPTISVLNL